MILSAPSAANFADLGLAMHDLVAELYPLCRSVAGPGVRETLRVLQRYLPLETREVPSGTKVFDWTVPNEWHIRDAYIKTRGGERVVDFRAHNLHVVNYSVPVKLTLTLAELRPHLHALPDLPRAIPYRTSYYHPTWGFCVSQEQLDRLTDDSYEVCIDSEHRPGSLTYGELYLPGESSDEVLISSHVCHPSLANDNLSGVAVAVYLARHLERVARRYSYRFVFAPATLGALCWLADHPQCVQAVKHGLVLTLLGDRGHPTYKRSRRATAEIDRAVTHTLAHSGRPYTVADFNPFGYDERQYGSPGFNLPVGCFMRTPPGQFPEYHTSLDNVAFVQPASLADSYSLLLSTVQVLERNRRYVSLCPWGEPQLGRRGLYQSLGGQLGRPQLERALLWMLNLSDGQHDLLAIAERAEQPFEVVAQAAETLLAHGLLAPATAEGPA